MQIIVILLLAIALALLVLGLIGSTPALVVASILASLVAMATIVRVRRRRAEAVRSAPPAAAPSWTECRTPFRLPPQAPEERALPPDVEPTWRACPASSSIANPRSRGS